MALPNGMSTFSITFGVAGVLGIEEPLGMNVTVTAATSAIWAATGQPFLMKKQTASAPVGQSGTMTLINPDQTGFVNSLGQQVKNWTLSFDIEYVDAAGRTVGKASKNLAYLTAMGSPIDLDLTIPVTTSAGVIVDIGNTGFVLPPGGTNGQALGLVNGTLGWITVTGTGSGTGGSGGGTPAPGVLAFTDNGDGTETITGTGVTDNGDGTGTINSTATTDNGDGTYTLVA